jgi:dTDP-4-dehydrorhamnose 3,5-epimerase
MATIFFSCYMKRFSEPVALIKIVETPLPGVLVLEPKVFGDARGYFLESYSERTMAEVGIRERFVQDNQSFSTQNVVRGLHYQVHKPQGKLIRVIEGEILDVALDLRKSSPEFGRWCAVRLSGDNKRMMWIPAGFAHGFRVVSQAALVLYKTTEFYAPELERTIAWNDPQLGIDWELDGQPIISPKDRDGLAFISAETFD